MRVVTGTGTGLAIRRVRSDDPRWDGYVDRHPGGVAFHRSPWLRVLEREYGQDVVALVAEDRSGAIRGVLPLMRTKGLPLGLGGASGAPRLTSLPRTPAAGPLGDDDDVVAALVREAIALTPAGSQLQLKPADAGLDGIPGLTGHPWRMNYVVPLPDAPDAIRFGPSRTHNRVVAANRRSVEAGVRVRHAETLGELRTWYRLYLATMRRHVVPPRPWRLFRALWEEMHPHSAFLVLAELDGRMVAGNVCVTDGRTAFYLFNGSDERAFEHRPNDALHFETITSLTASGHARYDMGEVVEGHDGLAQFKRKWGAEGERLVRYYAPAPDAAPDPGDGEHGRLSAAVHRAWPRTPLSATALAGRVAYRFL